MCKVEVALCDPEIHPLGLKECVPRPQSGHLDFTLNVWSGTQLVPLKSFKSVPLFGVQLVLQDGLPLL